MDALTINPFIESVHEIFESMLGCQADLGSPIRAVLHNHDNDITGVIGLSGTALGIIALRFPEETAIAVINRFAGTEFDKIDAGVIDGIGELVNIAAGSAKGRLKGHSISVSLPTVTRGGIYRLRNMRDTVWMDLPFDSELGPFSMIVALKNAVEKKVEVAHEGAGSR